MARSIQLCYNGLEMEIESIMLLTVDIVLDETHQKLRLDNAVTKHLAGPGRAFIAEAIRSGKISVNGAVIKKCSHVVRTNDLIQGTVEVTATFITTVEPEDQPLDIYYVDEHILVLHKPRGLVTHPGSGNLGGTLLNAIHFHYPSTRDLPKGGLVQRLDKDTSGLMVVALSIEAYQNLIALMLKRRIKRQYEALVWGRPPQSAKIDAGIGRHPRDRRLRAIALTGRTAITQMETIAYGKWGAKVLCTLQTGRTHQIRVHMKHLGYPICGDEMYGMRHPSFENPEGWRGQVLHAKYLAFAHPITEAPLSFVAPVPAMWEIWEAKLELLESPK